MDGTSEVIRPPSSEISSPCYTIPGKWCLNSAWVLLILRLLLYITRKVLCLEMLRFLNDLSSVSLRVLVQATYSKSIWLYFIGPIGQPFNYVKAIAMWHYCIFSSLAIHLILCMWQGFWIVICTSHSNQNSFVLNYSNNNYNNCHWLKNYYSWPLNNMGLNCIDPLICRFGVFSPQ